ncbi:uncharacterized protein SPSK_05695 [Sporothrix schenckii 1099-18]|uniref:Uncharacterized protein n=1 Tax=Sporothrix schenckii 1099-18 TaxID=1397361 RepID=A0A0F2LY91_SPOSC|nr:uncharacterized protein SPSK_05695 [Sporothrix schenckii 1099-18]KJR80871.1 hypothetical protein SPSK_05695 [Sporothrix schenckii 1099-18]
MTHRADSDIGGKELAMSRSRSEPHGQPEKWCDVAGPVLTCDSFATISRKREGAGHLQECNCAELRKKSLPGRVSYAGQEQEPDRRQGREEQAQMSESRIGKRGR